jgi:hypothetical protein
MLCRGKTKERPAPNKKMQQAEIVGLATEGRTKRIEASKETDERIRVRKLKLFP